jgi:hypothetical protein
MISLTVSAAAPRSSKMAMSTTAAGGARSARTVASVMKPSVPSLPVSKPTKSYSG